MASFAYVLLTHRNPDQVLRLATRLRELSPDAEIIVRHDTRGCRLDADPLRHLGVHVRQFDVASDWGRWNLVESHLTEIRWVRDQIGSDYVTLLSGQDYPISPLRPWEQQVADNQPDLQGEIYKIAYRPRWLRGGLGDHRAQRAMYRYHHVRTSATPESWWLLPLKALKPVVDLKSIARTEGLFIGRRVPLRGMQIWWAQLWLTLSRKAVDTLLEDVDAGVSVRRFAHAIIPDELFIATTLANTPGLRIVYEPLTYTRFQYEASHPDVLVADDLGTLRGLSTPFARKFDEPAVSPLLDALDVRSSGQVLADRVEVEEL